MLELASEFSCFSSVPNFFSVLKIYLRGIGNVCCILGRDVA